MKNFEWCVYTYRHRKMISYLIDKLIREPEVKAEMYRRAKDHDLDKMLLYLFFNQEECQNYHVMTQPHHLESGLGNSYEDLLETVIDFESAPYTKPDKPLNAFDFTHKLLEWNWITVETSQKLFRIMKKLGIDSSYQVTESDPEGMAYAAHLGEVTEEMILMEVMEYLMRHPKAYDIIKERAGKSLLSL